AADGHTFAAWRAKPTGAPKGAIVVVQEVFGVNSHIREVADGFAADGYLAIAPALFDRAERGVELGYDGADMDKARSLMRAVPTDQALADTQAAVNEAAAGGKVGVVGYCWGGTLAWLAATRLSGVAAAVGYYGGGVADARDEQPGCPVMLHFGALDSGIPLEGVRQVAAAHPHVPVHIYDKAGHGFGCDHRASYHAESAALARQRTVAFFDETLSV
ncbi:MAG: dienelactone hydrolase family protein, partial [Alphaproteobacteria bacterium]